jgi:hypothetical protein
MSIREIFSRTQLIKRRRASAENAQACFRTANRGNTNLIVLVYTDITEYIYSCSL